MPAIGCAAGLTVIIEYRQPLPFGGIIDRISKETFYQVATESHGAGNEGIAPVTAAALAFLPLAGWSGSTTVFVAGRFDKLFADRLFHPRTFTFRFQLLTGCLEQWQ
jgi:hypothetical protein